MTKYNTRVELHTATWTSDYDRLHAEMKKEGFQKVIQDDNTKLWYYLPTAEYYIEIELTIEQVSTLAENAAGRIGTKYSVLTTKSAGNCWVNLVPVKTS